MTQTVLHERRWTVRAFLLALVLACLLPGVLGATALFIYQYGQSREQLARTTVLTARAMVQAVDHHLLKVVAVGQALSTSDALVHGDMARFHREAEAAVRAVALGTNVVLRDEQGRQVLNTLSPWGRSLDFQPAPQQVHDVFATGRPTVSDMFIGPLLQRPIMSVDVPVFVDGRIRYALGIGILPKHFNDLLSQQHLPQRWTTGIMDRQGVLAARTLDPQGRVGKPASASLLAQMAVRGEGAGDATTLEGRQVVVFYSRSPSTGWSVAIGIPREDLDAVFVRTASFLALGVALLFAIGALTAWRIGGAITRGFEALSGAASALGTGRMPQVAVTHIAEAHQVGQALQHAAGLLQEGSRRKDEFIAVLAHELRNPLAPVRTAVEVLKRGAGEDPRQQRAREIIERQVGHMSRLVDDLLDVSRICRGTLDLHRERCDVARIASQTAEDYRQSVEAAGLQLVVDAGQAPLWVDGDPVRLAQMVGNLLNNAVRFTPSGGSVQVEVLRHAAQAQVRVSDTGVGITPQLQARLFAPFSQADQDLARSKGGLGLGLSLTRGLVQLHGGSISAHSAGPDRGSAFILTLPLAQPQPEGPPEPEPRLGPQPVPPAGGDPGAGAPEPALRILVIEDNHDAAHTLADLLTLMGHEVRIATEGEAGVAMAREFHPGVVISDIGLPGNMDGYAVGRALRADPQVGGVRLIALSGYADARARARSSESGFDLHLAKPVDLATLEAALVSPHPLRTIEA